MKKHKRRISWIVLVMMTVCLARAFAQDVLPFTSTAEIVQTTIVSETAAPAIRTPSSEVVLQPPGEPAVSLYPGMEPAPEAPAEEAVLAAVESAHPSQGTAAEPVTLPEETPAGESQIAPVAEAISQQESISTPAIEPAMLVAPEGRLHGRDVGRGKARESRSSRNSPRSPAEVVATSETNVMTELIELQPEESGGGSERVKAIAKENLISISLDNVPLQDVMRMFARISGANIVSGTNLQGNITVNLRDVEWQPALRTILDTAGMTLVMKSPGIYSVVSKSEAASAPVTIDTIYLKFTTVTNILPVIQKMLISSNASVAGFPAANTLVIQETSERLDIIKEVVTRIDKPRPQVFIEAKFVELNDEAIKDLGINWQSSGELYDFGQGIELGGYGKQGLGIEPQEHASADG